MSSSPKRPAAQPEDGVLASAMQRLTTALNSTTDVEGRLAAALYAATLPSAPSVTTSVDAFLAHGREELHTTLEATTDVESHLTLARYEVDLDGRV